MFTQSRLSNIRIAGFVLAELLIVGTAGHAKVIYVNLAAPGPVHNGSSWTNAYTDMGLAVTAARAGDEIWVAKGTYGANLFFGVGGVGLFGGFAGTEVSRDQRDYRQNVTVMTIGSITDQASGADAITISGFTFTGIGTGFYIDSSQAVISENVFTGNTGAYPGIVMYVLGSATITNNIITGNNDLGTGIIYIEAGADAVVSNNIITGNITTNGAGVYVLGTATIINNLIANNTAITNGAGIYVSGTATITNNTIVGNSIGSGTYKGEGAGIYVSGNATIANCIVANNSSGVFSTNPAISLKDTNVFGNSDYDFKGFASPVGANGNISADPLFVSVADNRLTSGSPCIDTGDDTLVTTGQTDLDGNPRIYGAHVDMGAYEFRPTAPFTLAEAGKAARIWAGLLAASAADRSRLDVETDGASLGVIDNRDIVRIARKVAHLDGNP